MSNEIIVQVLDCNRPDDTYFATLSLKKESNKINGYEYKTYDDHISFDTIDNVLDSAFSDPSRTEPDTTTLVYSSSSLNDSNLNEILPKGDAVSESNLYWTEQTSVTQPVMENTTIGMTDGYSLITTNVENAADITIDVSTATASVESIGDSSVGFSISYTTYDVDGINNEMTITSETERGVETQQTEDGIVISSEGNNHVEVSDGDNTVGFETNDASVLVKTDGAITVYEDSNNDGSYTNAVEVTPIGKTKIDENNTTINYSNDLPFNGHDIKAVDTVAYGNISLSEGIDYTITYTNNINVGTATVMITGIGNYEGTITKTFTINPAAIDKAEISAIEPATYTGKEQTPIPTVKVGEQTLTKDTDYSLSYTNNTNVGTATVTITGIGNYEGRVTSQFKINKADQSITAKATASSIAVGKTATVSTTGNKGKVTYTSSNAAIATVNASTGVVTGKKAGTVTITASAAATANYNSASKTVKITVTASKSLKKPGNCHFAKWNNSKYTSCRISWNKVDGAEGYQTLLSWTNGSNASRTIVKSNVLYRDCTVHPQHVSQMMVRAFYMSGGKRVFGPWSNVEYITPSPTKLTTQNASSGSNLKMNISWNIIYGCNGYNVFLTTNPNGTWYWNQSTTTKADATSAAITKYRGSKLKKNTRYYVRIVTRRKRNGVFCTVPMPASNTYIGSFIIK